MKTYTILVHLFSTIILVGCASAQSQDWRSALPKILRSMDRADLADPLFTLRNLVAKSTQIDPSRKEQEAKIKQLQDLEPWKRSKLRALIDQDTEGILKKSLDLAKNAPKSQSLASRDLEDYILRHVIAPITPVYGVSDTCFNQSMEYAKHLFINATPWAYQMLDSTGKTPDGIMTDTLDLCEILYRWTPHPTVCDYIPAIWGTLVFPKGNTIAIGHYEGCVAVQTNDILSQNGPDDFVGNYCYAELVAFENPPQLNKPSGYSDLLHPNSRVPGILDWINQILPDNMTDRELVNAYLDAINVNFGQCIPSGCSSDDFNINAFVIYYGLQATAVAFCGTQELDDEVTSLSTTGYGMVGLFGTIGALIAISTIADMILISYDLETDSVKKNFGWKLLKSFSAVSNGRKLLNTSSTSSLNLNCLNGIRVISMVWIVIGHTYLFFSSAPSIRPLFSENVNMAKGKDASLGYELVLNAFPAVDSFFFMSGLLVAYLSFFELEKGRFNLILFYVHRYIRLTIPLGLTIAFIVGFGNTFGHGPSWWVQGDLDIQFCRDNWWLNLLYLNNFIRQFSVCLGQTWYLACDVQMFILSPLFFWPMFKWRDNLTRVVQYWLLHMAIFTAVPVGLMIAYDLPPTHAMVISYDYVRFDMNAKFYSRFYTRLQPYLIGIMLGFVLYKTRGKEVKISWYMNVVGWLSSIALLVSVVFGLWNIRRDSTFLSRSFTMFESCFYQGFSRIAWGLALAWIVFACVKGYGGVINSFLSWGFFSPLAKLCFMVYFVHLDVIKYFIFSVTYTINIIPILMCYYIIGITMVSFGVSFVGSLLVEAPFINLEKIVIGKLLHKK